MDTRRRQAEYLNAQALATYLGVTERTVRRWIKSGALAAEKRGRSYSILREDGERMCLGGLAQVVDDRSSLERLLARREHELAVLEGRYAELQERNRHLEDALHQERRRAAALEARLELHVAAPGGTRRAA